MTASHKTPYYKNSAIFNTIGYIMVIAVNVMASLNILNGKSTAYISEKYGSLFTPAAITFSIWGLIYFTLLGFIIYQLWLAFSGKHQQELEQFMERLRGWWLVSCLANTCWLFSWHYELLPLSILIMLTLLVSLLAININFNIALQKVSWPEKLFIHLPFSLYLGWITIAAVANMAALWLYTGWNGLSISWTIFLILLCTIAATLLVIIRKNIVVGVVTLWGYSGIILKRQEAGGPAATPITIACIVAMVVIVITALIQLLKKR
ncbi:hypothetical protein SAMN05518672_102334 [Chitinophaga sp. CF118]|uniref:hypothetical protein n=1 Tax=Chitinophaga sp. CF118 TaxID=1884367 RepID=UPI0008F160ED|nr:hypothetical protein [Chitinophaga sp. CF118]SFD53498.1 hypothetical protein SAMN05518672_102334 [Chitinophaga sp. CF118]